MSIVGDESNAAFCCIFLTRSMKLLRSIELCSFSCCSDLLRFSTSFVKREFLLFKLIHILHVFAHHNR
eukprot:UN01768